MSRYGVPEVLIHPYHGGDSDEPIHKLRPSHQVQTTQEETLLLRPRQSCRCLSCGLRIKKAALSLSN